VSLDVGSETEPRQSRGHRREVEFESVRVGEKRRRRNIVDIQFATAPEEEPACPQRLLLSDYFFRGQLFESVHSRGGVVHNLPLLIIRDARESFFHELL
jgi:hypothetical protein